MTILRQLKMVLIFIIRRKLPTIDVAGSGAWRIVEPNQRVPFVISAGVGLNIDFELGLVKRGGVEMILLDPSSTGLATMQKIGKVDGIQFEQIGLAGADGVISFAKPLVEAEGSFFMASANVNADNLVQFQCKSLKTLMQELGKDSIDILKMDIEGAEYEVLGSLLRDKIKTSQICVEIHTYHKSGSNRGIWDAAYLILRLYFAGFRIVYNSAMDFTFVHRSMINSRSSLVNSRED